MHSVEKKLSPQSKMAQTPQATARSFVECVFAMVLKMKKDDPKSYDTVHALPFGDLYGIAMRMLIAREEFRGLGKPIDVVLRYHYTREENMASIHRNGLMNKQERAAHYIEVVQDNGNSYGPGIYTASNPCSYHGAYGDVGLLVACLLGTNTNTRATNSANADSRTFHRDDDDEIVIVSCAKQCIPILQFQAKQIDAKNLEHEGNEVLARYHAKLQQILDGMFVGA
jgi:hypothetical protein